MTELDTWGCLLLNCPDCDGEPNETNHGHTVVCLSCGLELGRDQWPDKKPGTFKESEVDRR